MTIHNDQESIKPPAEEKPLPCPFCGSNDIYECRDEYNAFCGECGAFGPGFIIGKIWFEAWNRRA